MATIVANPTDIVPVSMPDGSVGYTLTFDVGVLAAADVLVFDWSTKQYPGLLAVVAKNGVASAGESLGLYGYIDQGRSKSIPCTHSITANSQAYANVSAINMGTSGHLNSEYCRFSYTNGSTAQTALRIGLTIRP